MGNAPSTENTSTQNKNSRPLLEAFFLKSLNGIGVEEKYYEHIFGVFHQLHERDEYPRIGVGLAMWCNIANRHNGTIVAKSVAGQGSTFIITLPLKQAKK